MDSSHKRKFSNLKSTNSTISNLNIKRTKYNNKSLLHDNKSKNNNIIIDNNNKYNYDDDDDDDEDDDDEDDNNEDDNNEDDNNEDDNNEDDNNEDNDDDLNKKDDNKKDNNKDNDDDNKDDKESEEHIKLYNCTSDSSDSEYEFDEYTTANDYALNLLIKKQRHNYSCTNLEIINMYNNQIKKLDKNYKKYLSENKNKKDLLLLKKRIEKCKEIEKIFREKLSLQKSKFKFHNFIKFMKCTNNSDVNNEINEINGKNEKDDFNTFIYTFLQPNNRLNSRLNTKTNNLNNQTTIDTEFEKLYDQDNNNQSSLSYFKSLDKDKKKFYLDKLKEIKKSDEDLEKRPNYMKILDYNISESNKSLLLQKISVFENLRGSSEYNKLKPWINKIMKVPFDKYIKPPVTRTDGPEKIREYLSGVRAQLDNGIYGHETTKDQLIKILAHTITNPTEGGNVFALQGPPGVGKTALIKDGIAKALGRPYAFISLGGATDACFLEGHDYTYEGSNNGRILEVIQQTGCMNPVIYFDELDKVSETAKGEEIINILMHITDSTQNSHFNDKYFGAIDFDLSKAIIIFSFNNEQKISRILLDRMKIIRVKGYKILDKLIISKNYLIPNLLKQIGLDDINIEFNDKILEFIIDNYTNEGGVRKFKEILNDIFLEINLRKLENSKINGKKIKDKLKITTDLLENDFLKKKRKIEHLKINSVPKIGIVNGLWANDYGIGGLIPIECCWIPSTEKLQLELTGMQGKVMKESMSVARTIAWRILPDDLKEKLNTKWKDTFDYGIHIHCPDGSTPKDGPSAGGAITTCLISLLAGIQVNNKVAMTGEINLKGQITAIGGLEEKIFGAKKAGATLVLCPKENKKDVEEIKEKFPNLFNENFEIKTIETILDILDIVLIEKLDWIKFG